MASAKVCELHGTILRHTLVHLTYGLQQDDPDFWDACQRLFPNANSVLNGGCCVGSAGSEAEAWVCEECRKAEVKWRQKGNWREAPWQHWTEK